MAQDGQEINDEHHHTYILYTTKDEESTIKKFLEEEQFIIHRGTLPRVMILDHEDIGVHGIRIISYFPITKEDQTEILEALKNGRRWAGN